MTLHVFSSAPLRSRQTLSNLSRASKSLCLLALLMVSQSPVVLAQTNLPPFIWSLNVNTVKISITPQSRYGLFRETDNITISTSDGGSVRVLALDGTLVYSGPGLTRQYPRGHYFVETAGDRSQFAVLPADYGLQPFLGTHGTGVWAMGDAMKQSTGPTWDRSFSARWRGVQSTSNTWDWTESDPIVAAVANAGRKLILTGMTCYDSPCSGGVPTWVSHGNSYSDYTNNLVCAYTNYVAAILNRYGDNLYAFEILNEPGTDVLGITNSTDVAPLYLTLAKATKKVRDQIAPQIKLLGPSWQGADHGDNQYLRDNGINDILDDWSWHDYDAGQYAPDQDYSATHWLIERLQSNYGDASLAKETVVGELGLFGRSALGCPPPQETQGYMTSGTPGVSWYRGLCRAIKLATMYRAAGLTTLIPQNLEAFNRVPGSNWEIFGYDYGPSDQVLNRGPHPKTSAFLMTCYWVGTATPVDYRRLGEQISLFAFQRGGQALVMAWCTEDTTQTVNQAVAPSAMNIYGVSIQPTQLTEQPVIFTSTNVNAATLLSNVMAAVPPLNLSPVWSPVPNANGLAGQTLQFTVAAVDPDHDPLTYSVSPLPSGASFNATTGVFSWTPSVAQAGSYSLAFTATDARGLSATTTMILTVLRSSTDGLVGYWSLDQTNGIVAADSAGTNPGTLQNFSFNTNSGWVTGKFSQALQFDGVNDYVSLNSTSAVLSLTNNFAISVWIRPANAAAQGNVFFSARWQYGMSGIRLFVDQNAIVVNGIIASGGQQNRFGVGEIQNGIWSHVVVVYDKSVLHFYLNGVEKSESWGGNQSWGGDLIMNMAGATGFGAENQWDRFYSGAIDDLRIYNRTLTPAEIVALYNGSWGSSTNQPPVLAAIGNQSVNEGQSLSFTVSATDPNSTNLTYSASGLPTGASFNTSTHTFSWTPTYSQAGSYNVTLAVSDGSLSDSETITITVSNVDRAPVLAAISNQTVNEGANLSFSISGSDPDGDPLSYSAGGLPAGATFSATNQVFSWTPTYSQAGNYNVTFTVSDGTLSASQTVNIAVLNVNRPPVLSPISNQTVNENQALTFTISGTDPDGNALTYSASGLPGGASFNSSTRTFSWTPSYSQAGSYNVAFAVSDGTLTASQTVAITVNNVNRPPVLNSIGNKSVTAGQLLSFVISGSDPDGDALTYSASGLPAGATFNTSTRAFSWTPTFSQAGNYSVTFTVSDGSLTASETITISVGSVNQPPVLAAIGSKSVNEGQTLSFTLSATDPAGGTLTYSVTGLPSGAAFNTTTGAFAWTPTYTQAGNYSVTFTVSDGSLTDSETIAITVANVNRAPILAALNPQTVIAGQTLNFTVSATDPDGDALTYSAPSLPAGATFDTSSGNFAWTPTDAQTGTVNVVFSASDGSLSASATVAITVTAAITDAPPELAAIDIVTGVANSPLDYQFVATDPDGDPLTYSASGLPTGANVGVTTGLLTWTPSNAQVGVFNAVIMVSDGHQTVQAGVPMFIVDPNYDWLAGTKLFAYQVLNNNTIFVYAYRCPDQTSMVIAWCTSGANATLSATSGLTRTDLYNQPYTATTLGAQPVLFHTGKRVSPRQALGIVTAAIHY